MPTREVQRQAAVVRFALFWGGDAFFAIGRILGPGAEYAARVVMRTNGNLELTGTAKNCVALIAGHLDLRGVETYEFSVFDGGGILLCADAGAFHFVGRPDSKT